jgi:hypothetical protein
VLSSELETPFASCGPRGFVYFELLACDRIRQKSCLQFVSADDSRYDDEVESQIRRTRDELEYSFS